jgi:hypothetical protein
MTPVGESQCAYTPQFIVSDAVAACRAAALLGHVACAGLFALFILVVDMVFPANAVGVPESRLITPWLLDGPQQNACWYTATMRLAGSSARCCAQPCPGSPGLSVLRIRHAAHLFPCLPAACPSFSAALASATVILTAAS